MKTHHKMLLSSALLLSGWIGALDGWSQQANVKVEVPEEKPSCSVCMTCAAMNTDVTPDLVPNLMEMSVIEDVGAFSCYVSYVEVWDGMTEPTCEEPNGQGGFRAAGNMSSTTPDGFAVIGDFAGVRSFDNIYLAHRKFEKSNGQHDIVISRYGEDGVLDWATTIGGSGDDRGHSLVVTNQQEILFAGQFEGTVGYTDVNGDYKQLTAVGASDVIMGKLNASGDILWLKAIGSDGAESGLKLVLNAEGHLLLAGTYDGKGFNWGNVDVPKSKKGDFFLAMLNDNAEALWVQTYGGSGQDVVSDMAVDGNGNLWLTGTFQQSLELGSTTLTGVGTQQLFVARLAPDGTTSWAGSTDGYGSQSAAALVVDSEDNILIAGQFEGSLTWGPEVTFQTGTSGSDLLLAKLSNTGEMLWARHEPGQGVDRFYGLALDVYDHVLVAGSFSNNLRLNGFPLESRGETDALFAIYDGNGILLDVQQDGGSEVDLITAVIVTEEGRVRQTGMYQGRAELEGMEVKSDGLFPEMEALAEGAETEQYPDAFAAVNAETCFPLEGWKNEDKGAVQYNGNVCFRNDAFQVLASGAGIAQGEFHEVQLIEACDRLLTLEARVESFHAASLTAESGLGIRYEVGQQLALTVDVAGTLWMTKWNANGKRKASRIQLGQVSLPVRLKLVHEGEKVLCFTAQGGEAWTPLVAETLQGTGALFGSLLSTAGNADELAMTTINQVNYSCDGVINQVTSDIVGEEGVKVYPNPSRGTFTLEFVAASSTSINVVLFDAIGRVVKSFNSVEVDEIHQQTINLGAQNSGIYYLQVRTPETTYMEKVIVE